MARTIFACVVFFLLSLPVPVNSLWAADPGAKGELTYNPDVDLEKAPASYRERVKKFRGLLRNEKTRQEKIALAMSLAQKTRSPFRIDAINFLADVRAEEATGVLISLAPNAEVREFVLYALGRIRDPKTVPVLIQYLTDESDNVRGNAQGALERILGWDLGFSYSDSPSDRLAGVKRLKAWWKSNGATFKPAQPTVEEKKEAEEAWKKFGEPYLNDLSR